MTQLQRPKLSVLVPGIRVNNWIRLYESIERSFDRTFEVIFIGPYEPPRTLIPKDERGEFTFIRDFGSPIRCQQIGLTKAIGEFVTWAADDGVFLDNALSIAVKTIEQKGHNYVVMGKYLEGNNDGAMSMKNNDYYILSRHDASRSQYIPNHYLMLNVGVVSLDLLLQIGGWDCQFEVCPMAYNDLAIRLQNFGSEFIVQDEIMYTCSHMPGHAGDHGPIHDAQTLKDQPLFKQIYSDPIRSKRDIIDIDNWIETPDVWLRRFKKSELKEKGLL